MDDLDGVERRRLFKKHGVSLILPAGRIAFETPSGQGSGPWLYAVWVCWQIPLPAQIVFPEE